MNGKASLMMSNECSTAAQGVYSKFYYKVEKFWITIPSEFSSKDELERLVSAWPDVPESSSLVYVIGKGNYAWDVFKEVSRRCMTESREC